MNAIPTTTVTILGSADGVTAPDQWGDTVEGDSPAGPTATGIPAAIHTGRRVVATESDPHAVVVRYFTGRLPAGTQVTDAQRLLDERTGQIYVIDQVTEPQSSTMPQDLSLDLRRVT